MCHINVPSFAASLYKTILTPFPLSTCLPPTCCLAANISHVTLTAKQEFKYKPLENEIKEDCVNAKH